MTCERLNDWLTGETPACRELPPDLRLHVDSCPECRALWQGVQNLRREAESVVLPASERLTMWNDLQKRRQATAPQGKPLQQKPQPAASPVSLSVPPAFDLVSWLSQWSAPALAFGIVLLAAAWIGLRAPDPGVGPTPERPVTAVVPVSRPTPAWAMLKGRNARMLISGRWASGDLTGRIGVAKAAEVEMPTEQGLLTVAYADGGEIAVRGSGRLLVKPDGFQTRDGRFTATFKRGKEPFTVLIPGAALEVRGTIIAFSLKNGEGTIELISGKVHVTPEVAGSLSFDWQAGVKLVLTGGLLKPAAVSTPSTASVASTPGEITPGEPLASSGAALAPVEPDATSVGDLLPDALVGGTSDGHVATNPLSVLLRFQPEPAPEVATETR